MDKTKQKGNYLLATIGCETDPATEFLHTLTQTHTPPAPACLDSTASVLQSPLCYQTKASSDPNEECLHGYNITTLTARHRAAGRGQTSTSYFQVQL